MQKVTDMTPRRQAQLAQEQTREQRTSRVARIVGGTAAAAIALAIGIEASQQNDPQSFMQKRLEQGQVYRGASVTIEKGTKFLDRPAVVNNEQGTSVEGTFMTTKTHYNPIIISGFDNERYIVTENPDLTSINPPTTIEELSKVGVAVPLQPGELRFKKGTAGVEMVMLANLAHIPSDADITNAGEAK